MSNITITNVDNGSVELEGGEFRDETLAFAAADTFVAGTLLARRAVVTAITPSAITGTGNGTITLVSVKEGPVVPLVGNYVLRCMTTVTHGGVWQLEDPNGNVVATGLTMTAGAGVATAFEAGGIGFTLTDGSTDFVAGATFTLPVVASGKLVPFDPAGVGGAQIPLAVLTYDVTRADAGDVAIRALIAGKVNKRRLLIDADGDGDNITNAILDQLRSMSIVPIDVSQLSKLDNQ